MSRTPAVGSATISPTSSRWTSPGSVRDAIHATSVGSSGPSDAQSGRPPAPANWPVTWAAPVVTLGPNRWAAFEVKLSPASVDEASSALRRFKATVDTSRHGEPFLQQMRLVGRLENSSPAVCGGPAHVGLRGVVPAQSSGEVRCHTRFKVLADARVWRNGYALIGSGIGALIALIGTRLTDATPCCWRLALTLLLGGGLVLAAVALWMV